MQQPLSRLQAFACALGSLSHTYHPQRLDKFYSSFRLLYPCGFPKERPSPGQALLLVLPQHLSACHTYLFIVLAPSPDWKFLEGRDHIWLWAMESPNYMQDAQRSWKESQSWKQAFKGVGQTSVAWILPSGKTQPSAKCLSWGIPSSSEGC